MHSLLPTGDRGACNFVASRAEWELTRSCAQILEKLEPKSLRMARILNTLGVALAIDDSKASFECFKKCARGSRRLCSLCAFPLARCYAIRKELLGEEHQDTKDVRAASTRPCLSHNCDCMLCDHRR